MTVTASKRTPNARPATSRIRRLASSLDHWRAAKAVTSTTPTARTTLGILRGRTRARSSADEPVSAHVAGGLDNASCDRLPSRAATETPRHCRFLAALLGSAAHRLGAGHVPAR